MCSQRDSMQAVREAALCLREACVEGGTVAVVAPIVRLYDRVLGEPVPKEIVEILAQMQ